jgi:oxaloacetate decarboxylase alpha subunit
VPSGETELPAAPVQQAPAPADGDPEAYSVSVDGKVYEVVVAPSGELTSVVQKGPQEEASPQHTQVTSGEALNAPLAGNIFKVLVTPGSQVNEGDVVIIMEAMKMETEVRAASSGTVASVSVSEGDAVSTGDVLLTLG